jgi:hypothetical protein
MENRRLTFLICLGMEQMRYIYDVKPDFLFLTFDNGAPDEH